MIEIRAYAILLLLILGLLTMAAIAKPPGNVSPGNDWLSPGYAYTYWHGYPDYYSWYPAYYYPYSYYNYPSYYYYPSWYYYPSTYRSYYWYPDTYYGHYRWYW